MEVVQLNMQDAVYRPLFVVDIYLPKNMLTKGSTIIFFSVEVYWSPSTYRTPAVIGRRRIVWRFSAHARIASISLGEGAS